MKRVLITRPEPGATQTADRLASLGFFPVVAPVLSIVINKIDAASPVAATVLTSQNAVAACPPSLHTLPVFAVGTATAAHATKMGFAQVVNADGDATALENLVATTLSTAGGSLFLPVGQGQGMALATSLRQRGFHVQRRIAYQAAGVAVLPEIALTHLRQGYLNAVMFFSGETSRHFVRLIHAANLADAVRNIEAVSISDRAAVALRSLPWRRINVAAKPTQDAMLVLLNE